MSDNPVVYLFHGEDEFAISRQVETLKEKMGDPSMADMNTTRLASNQFTVASLKSAAYAMPFLLDRRLVILENVLGQLRSKANQQSFLETLDQLPQSTALVITEKQTLKSKHWLIKWGKTAGKRSYMRGYSIPKGAALQKWIRQEAQQRGGEFTPAAAAALATLVPEDPRMVTQEIEKLLAYVNYQRAVEPDDVEHLTADMQQASIFKMVDAVGACKQKEALLLLRKVLEERDPLSTFGMIVRQFRLLLLTSELLQVGSNTPEIAQKLRVPEFVVRNMTRQSRNFSLQELDAIFRNLLEVDAGIKTGKIKPEIALDTLVATLTEREIVSQ